MGIPVGELKLRISSTEFLKWVEFLNEEEVKPPTRLEQYLAQIAAEIRIQRLSGGRKKLTVRLKDLFLHFAFKSSVDTSASSLSPEELAEKKKAAAAVSKARWLAVLGIKRDE